MSETAPIYTFDNSTCAFQLIWNLTLFWREPFPDESWLPQLRSHAQSDGIRILQHKMATSDCSMLLVSTRPHLNPARIVRRIKGPLQTFIRNQRPKAFQRNYNIHSIGSTTRDKTENYVAGQLTHHDIRAEALQGISLSDLQIIDPDVDLGRYRFTSHGRYRCNLHVVLRFREEFAQLNSEQLVAIRIVVRRTAQKHRLLLSRLGLLLDHLHLVIGIPIEASPAEVAYSLMNNIAWIFGMQPVLWHSCYLGTVGEYDLGAVRD